MQTRRPELSWYNIISIRISLSLVMRIPQRLQCLDTRHVSQTHADVSVCVWVCVWLASKWVSIMNQIGMWSIFRLNTSLQSNMISGGAEIKFSPQLYSHQTPVRHIERRGNQSAANDGNIHTLHECYCGQNWAKTGSECRWWISQ